MRILVTGATGYIGGRLTPQLLELGHEVRVFVRDEKRVLARSWADQVEIVTGDLFDLETIPPALAGVDAAYYLVHSMTAGPDFASQDRAATLNFALSAYHAGIKHVIYLGGLLPESESVSEHLRSRAEVGQILRHYCPATEFRAGPIIGSGSASFEMVRYLTERLPLMITPKWVQSEVQPIAVRDILSYLAGALETGPLGVVEVGANRLTFRQMMEGYAAARGLRRMIVPVPVLAPRLAALWIGLVTPITNNLAVPLVEGLVDSLRADTARARHAFPQIEPISYDEAVWLAVTQVEEGQVETRWSGSAGRVRTYELTDERGIFREVRTQYTELSPEALYRSFSSIGGERGWLVWTWAWALRGLLDQMMGGPGLRRGRRHPLDLLPGEALDFWRVEAARPHQLLRLRAEMRVPGTAWLQWETVPEATGTRIVQTALFAPEGLLGLLYWYALYPVHKFIFDDLLHAIIAQASQNQSAAPASRQA